MHHALGTRALIAGVVLVGSLWAVAPAAETPAENNVDQELQFIYIGGNNCGLCRNPKLKDALHQARALFEERAKAKGMAFVTIGVAVDSSVEEGLKFLAENATFDQIVVGGHFKNLAMTEYVWTKPRPGLDDLPNDGVPQVIIAERTFSSRAGRIVPSETRILGYASGTIIPMWVEKGAPLKE